MTVRVHVAGKVLTDMVREVVALWERTEPAEVAAWKAHVIARRANLKRASGMSDGGELMSMACLPLWVILQMGRLLNDPCWMEHDQLALQALCEALPLARMNTTSGLVCAGDKNRVAH